MIDIIIYFKVIIEYKNISIVISNGFSLKFKKGLMEVKGKEEYKEIHNESQYQGVNNSHFLEVIALSSTLLIILGIGFTAIRKDKHFTI